MTEKERQEIRELAQRYVARATMGLRVSRRERYAYMLNRALVMVGK